ARAPRAAGQWNGARAFHDRGARHHGKEDGRSGYALLIECIGRRQPMKWSTMRASERRTIVFGAAVVLIGLVPVYVVRPYRAALTDARDQLATERQTLVRERAAIATAHQNPQLQHIADSAMRAMRPRLFEGRDDVMASAELASYLGEVAHGARVWLQDA